MADSPARDRRVRSRRSPSPTSDHESSRRRRHRDQHDDGHQTRRRDDPRTDHRRRRSSRSPHTRRSGHSHRRDNPDDDTARRSSRRELADDSDEHDRPRRRRHRSPDEERSRERRRRPHRDDSDTHRKERSSGRHRSRSPTRDVTRSKGPLPSQQDAYTQSDPSAAPPAPEKEKPNFGNSGRLAAESNTVSVNGGGGTVVLKYHEPAEARKPPAKEPWRLYVFKGEDLLEVVEISERSCWLVGREHLVVDFPLEHPSCSKQHAALQFRYVDKRNEFGDRVGRVKPYLIDLESANGSKVNGEVIPPGRGSEH
ncbi:hypothetical protein FE257_005011 [Aspergillus nanangensis]|uniref:FHA domain-containing protein n=1 Tax=Aspergillus nanangensis TaxID=2582783 RepID=A0AAD4CQY0_ASPNN|nr:hypothetical protein FE257_005011 [Aspergillus nanangensis]